LKVSPDTQQRGTSWQELVAKLGSGFEEVRDRALRALVSKLDGGLVPLDAVSSAPGLPQLILHWINDRQTKASPELMRVALRLIVVLAQTPCLAHLHEAGCVRFLEEFKQNAAEFAPEVEAAIAALLYLPSGNTATSMSDVRKPSLFMRSSLEAAGIGPGGSRQDTGGGGDNRRTDALAQERPLLPPKAAMHASAVGVNHEAVRPFTLQAAAVVPQEALVQKPGPPIAQLTEADERVVMDLGVRLKFGEASTLEAACSDLRDLLVDMPASAVSSHGALVEGICHALAHCHESVTCRGGGCPVTCAHAVHATRALVGRLLLDCISPFAGFRAFSLDIEELHPITESITTVCQLEWLPLIAPMYRIIAELLRRSLRHPCTVAPAHELLKGLLKLCSSPVCGKALGRLDAAQSASCLQLAGEALCANLEGRQQEVNSLLEALQWFDGMVVLPCSTADTAWREPLRTHDWSWNALVVFDVFLDIIRAVGVANFSSQIVSSTELGHLVRTLLFDYRLLFERPAAADVMLQCGADSACPDDSREFAQFRELVTSATTATMAPHPTTSGLKDAQDELARIAGRVGALDQKLRLVTLEDTQMQPQGVVLEIIALVSEIAHLRNVADGGDGLSLQALCGSVASLCRRLAVCPDTEQQDHFFQLLEAEPGAAWLYNRTDFVTDCLCHGHKRAGLSVVRWRQGDCATADAEDVALSCADRLSPEMNEFVEARCNEISTSTLAAALRRLFETDTTRRQDAALLLWRSEVSSRASLLPALKFGTDPVGSVMEEARGTLDSYCVEGLRASSTDLDHLLNIATSARLGWDVRAAALVQVATFTASDPSGTLEHLGELQNLALLIVDALRSTPMPEALAGRTPAEQELGGLANSPEEFLARLCHLGVLLLIAAGASSWAAHQLRRHRDALLDRLLLFVFYNRPRLRTASLQLAACLLFDPPFTFRCATSCCTEGLGRPRIEEDRGSVAHVPEVWLGEASEKGWRPQLVVPPWLGGLYKLPVPSVVVQEKASAAAKFWECRHSSRTAALCQVFHRLRIHTEVPRAEADEGLRRNLDALLDGCCTSTSDGVSIVWRRTERVLFGTYSTDELLEAAGQVALVPPTGAWLLQNRLYLPRLLGSCNFPMEPPVGDGNLQPNKAQRAALTRSHSAFLEHVRVVLDGLPQGGFCNRKPVERLADALRTQVIPDVLHLAEVGDCAARLHDGAVPEAAAQRAHGRLAADAATSCTVKAMLRVYIALARRRELDIQWLVPKDWMSSLAVLISSSVRSLRRLSLAAAVLTVTAARERLGVSVASKVTGQHACTQGVSSLLDAAIGSLAAPMACLGSLQHSFEIKAALWLVHELVSAGVEAVSAAEVISACSTHWLSHKDPVICALAWRALRALRLARPAGTCDTEEVAAFARAVRALRVPRGSRGDTPGLEALVHAEVLEFIRMSLEAAAAVSLDRRVSYAKQVLETEPLMGELLPLSLSSSHCGLRRAALRTLRTLLAADRSIMHGLMLRSGLWQRAAAAALVDSEGDIGVARPEIGPADLQDSRRSACALDEAVIMGDVLALVRTAVSDDPQMLLWLASSTDLFMRWHSVVVSLVAVAKDAPLSRRYIDAAITHLSALSEFAGIVKAQLSTECSSGGSPLPPSALDCWTSASQLFQAPSVSALLAEGLHERMPPPAREAAAAALAMICGLRYFGLGSDTGSGVEELLGRRACAYLLWTVAQSDPADAAGAIPAAEDVANRCLANLLRTSAVAAAASLQSGLLSALTHQLAAATSRSPPPHPRTADSHPQRVVWTLRLLAALLTSCGAALRHATQGSSVCADVSGGVVPPLVTVLLRVRAAAERDEVVCLEVLDLLCQCAHADLAGPPLDGTDEGVPALLFRFEFVQWLMRLTRRPKLSPIIYCRALDVLSLCAHLLTSKPVLLKYLTHIAEVIRSSCRAQSCADEWRCRRQVATLRFIASLRLCPRCVELLVGPVSSAHLADPLSRQGGLLGMDFWLDLVEHEARSHAAVRVAALRVLLAVVSSSSPHAKAYFVGSDRALSLLLTLLRGGAPQLVVTALNIIWVLAHNHQRAVTLLRRMQAAETIHGVVATWPGKDTEEITFVALLGRQLATRLGP